MIASSLFAAALLCLAQQGEPHIGYLYPAGAERGASVDVWVGGQFLRQVETARFTGEGVRAAIVGHYRPLNNQQRNALRQKIRQLRQRKPDETTALEQTEAEKEGIEIPPLPGVTDLELLDREELAELQRRYFDPRKQPNPQIGETVVLRLMVDEDAPPGPRELRLITPRGSSNPMRFEVGTLTEYQEEEPNDREADRGTMSWLPVVINGQVMPGDVDRFRFHALEGTRLVVVAQARELIPYLADAVPGWFQATLALYDAQGRELSFVDDFRFHPDPVLAFEIPRNGEYVVEIRDSIYRGREDFVYRLTLGEIPYLTSLYPLGAQAGARAALRVGGWNLPTDWVVLDRLREEPGQQPVAVAAGEGLTNPLPFALSELPEAEEREPNSRVDDAQPLELPVIVNGRIGEPGDLDLFRFEGKSGDRLVVEVVARRLGSPLDSLIRLTDASGNQLAVNDDHEDPASGLITHHADSTFRYKLRKRGSYYLWLGDTQGQGGEAFGYRLRIGPPQPDFELRVVPSAINVEAGGSAVCTVHAVRKDGFDGEVEVALVDPPEGFTLSGGIIQAGQDSARMTLRAPAEETLQPVPLELVGRARIRGRRVERRAVPAEDMMQAFLWRHLVPVEELLASVVKAGGMRTPLELAKEEPWRIPLGGKVKVKLRGRVKALPEDIRLVLQSPPEGITVEKLELVKGGLAFTLRADRKATPKGLAGNLIVEVWADRYTEKDGERVRSRTRKLGILPAVPFRVVKI